jgi:hypothetical protein
MEVYYGIPEQVKHTIFYHGALYDSATDVTLHHLTRNEEGVLEESPIQAVAVSDGVWSADLFIDNYSEQYIYWSYFIGVQEVNTVREPLTVVNPVTTYDHFRSQYPTAHMSNPSTETSYQTFRRLEKLARKIIERYCNQTFTREDGDIVTAVGQDSDRLALPRRIIRIDDVYIGDDRPLGLASPRSITSLVTFDANDPWTLRMRQRDGSRKVTPVSSSVLFKYPTVYSVKGDWGWEDVPQDVYHAADIIINDLTHPDAKYREKMANVIRAADWRMEFAETGMETTGNANADMLLSQYRLISAGVI